MDNISELNPDHHPRTLLGMVYGSDAEADRQRPRIRAASAAHERDRLARERYAMERRQRELRDVREANQGDLSAVAADIRAEIAGLRQEIIEALVEEVRNGRA